MYNFCAVSMVIQCDEIMYPVACLGVQAFPDRSMESFQNK